MSGTYSIDVTNLPSDNWGPDSWQSAHCRRAGGHGSNTHCSHYGLSEFTSTKSCDSTCMGDVFFTRDYCWDPTGVRVTFGATTTATPVDGTTITPDPSLVTKPSLKDCHTANPPVISTSTFKIADPSGETVIDDIPEIIKQYYDNGNITKLEYDNYMKAYCFANVSSNCSLDPATGQPYKACPRYFQNGNARTYCDDWRKISPDMWDTGVSNSCNDPANIKMSYCDCIGGSITGSRYHDAYDAVASQLGSQNPQCWFKPCKDYQTRFVRSDEFDATGCKIPDCSNIAIFTGNTDVDANIRQTVNCTGDFKKQQKGEKCNVDQDCDSGLNCDNGTCVVTKKDQGASCAGDDECVSGYCNPKTKACDIKVKPKKQKGDDCTADDDCADGLSCINGKCDTPPTPPPGPTPGGGKEGDDCKANADCDSGYCEPTTSMCAKKPDGYCESDADCGGGTCDMDTNRCQKPTPKPDPPTPPACDGYTIFGKCVSKKILFASIIGLIAIILFIMLFSKV